MPDRLDATAITQLFTGTAGGFRFARWRRPIVPVAFGVDDPTLATLKGAIEAVAAQARHPLAETDPDQGANLLIFFVRDWSELAEVPDLDQLVEGLGPRLARLREAQANQYRHFRFESDGAIRACIAFFRLDEDLAALPAEVLALSLAAQVILLWSDQAFAGRPALARAGGRAVLRPDVAELIRAAYDPVLPDASEDSALALRLAARLRPPA